MDIERTMSVYWAIKMIALGDAPFHVNLYLVFFLDRIQSRLH